MKRINFNKLYLTGVMLLITVLTNAQISSDKWPEAKVSYFEKPKAMVKLNLLDSELGPILGLFYGVGADYRINNKFNVGADVILPMLDKSFVNGGVSAKMYSVNGEYIFKQNMKKKNSRITLDRKSVGNNMEEITYRDYDIMTPVEKTLRFSLNYYKNSVKPSKLNTKGVQHYYTYDEPAFYLKNGGTGDGIAEERVLFVSLGMGWKDFSYYNVEMPDINRSVIYSTLMTSYVDILYSPMINLVDRKDYKKMPFGFRLGAEVNYNKHIVGSYFNVELGMLPAVGTVPLFFKIGFGLNLQFPKQKIAEKI